MNEDHVMIDLETADSCPTAAIVSIGAVVFAGTNVNRAFYQPVDLHSAVAAGCTTSADTLAWWAKQSVEAQAVFDDPQRCSLGVALDDFAAFMSCLTEPRVWGNGASFDNAILATSYRLTGRELPWKFWNDRCYRTVVAGLARREQTGVHHNALDDARSQARHLLAVAPQAIR